MNELLRDKLVTIFFALIALIFLGVIMYYAYHYYMIGRVSSSTLILCAVGGIASIIVGVIALKFVD